MDIAGPKTRRLCAGLFICFAICAAAHALDLTELPLEALLNIEVITLSRKAQARADAAAPVFVLTSEDLRRVGVRSLPDAMRLVPGLFVAQVDANKWVVTSRGFADGLPTQQIASYTTCDVHAAWRITPDFMLSLVGRNLFQKKHTEFISAAASTLPSYVEREVFGAVRWTF